MSEPKRYWCQEGTMLAATSTADLSTEPLYVRTEHYDELRSYAVQSRNAALEEAAHAIGELDGGERDRDEALHEAMQTVLALKTDSPQLNSTNALHPNVQDGRGSSAAGSCETAERTQVANPGESTPCTHEWVLWRRCATCAAWRELPDSEPLYMPWTFRRIRAIADFQNRPGEEMAVDLMGRLEAIWHMANACAPDPIMRDENPARRFCCCIPGICAVEPDTHCRINGAYNPPVGDVLAVSSERGS